MTNNGSVCEMGVTKESLSELREKEINPAAKAPKIPAFQNNRKSLLTFNEILDFEKNRIEEKKRKDIE
jgi:hypothetical protein